MLREIFICVYLLCISNRCLLASNDFIIRRNVSLHNETNRRSFSKIFCPLNKIMKKIDRDMEAIESKYSKVLDQYRITLNKEEFDKKAVETILNKKGIPDRLIVKYNNDATLIPTGINLGEDCFIILTNSMLFFHRLKLKDNTKFMLNSLYNDASKMTIYANFSVYDLHMQGIYDRVLINETNLSELTHVPNLGELDIILYNAKYISEVGYRLVNDRFQVVLVHSDLKCDQVTITYRNKDNITKPIPLEQQSVEPLFMKLKINFNNWVESYMNDYFGNNILNDKQLIKDLLDYDAMRIMKLNEHVDNLLNMLSELNHKINDNETKVPDLQLRINFGGMLSLHEGVVFGAFCIHRRSVALTRIENGVRFVDAEIFFSNIKITYKYKAVTGTDVPEMNGMMVFSADNLKAHMHIVMLKDPETWEMQFDSFQEKRPVTLTLEGPLMREAGKFQYILNHHIMTLMSNFIYFISNLKGSQKACDQNRQLLLKNETRYKRCVIFNVGCGNG